MATERLQSIQEVAGRLALQYRTVYRLAVSGQIPARVGEVAIATGVSLGIVDIAFSRLEADSKHAIDYDRRSGQVISHRPDS